MTSDAALVLRARGGDELAFRRLANELQPMLRFIASRYWASGAERSDMDQEAMIGLHKAVRDYRPDRGTFRAFAKLCVERQCITALKLSRGRKHQMLNEAASLSRTIIGGGDTEDTELGDLLPDQTATDPVRALEAGEEMRAVIDASLGLSEWERASITGIAEGRSYEEISAEHDIPLKTIDNAAQRARRKLAAALEAA